jgi:hypothetical protein
MVGFVLTGATVGACQAGEVTTGGDDAAVADGGSTCTPASCAGLAAPALAKVCSDGTALSANVCEDQGAGRCGWGFPACPTSDACSGATALPCVPCPYGSVGTGKDQNGCDTCPICAPAPDASVDAGTTCTADSDCASGRICGFAEVGGCGIEGTCFPAPGAICQAFSPGCACDGSEINVICNGLPSGYGFKPLRHTGACVDGG